MTELVLHRGAKKVTKDQLDLIPLPQATDSYQPVSHYYLADKLTTIGQDILTDYALVGENYAVARQGQQLFSVLKFQKHHSEMALSVGFRNSYDRSMSIGIAIGASVFVCDNLALQGEVAVMKKHTKNVWTALEDLAITTLYKSGKNFEQIINDSEVLKYRSLENEQAFQMMGLLFGKGIISPRQITVLKNKWLKPEHPEFQPRNEWSFYNACTDALKSTPPVSVMEKHIRLHDELTKTVSLPF